jgi:hypothetical protein
MQIRMRTREQGKAEKSLRAMTDIDDGAFHDLSAFFYM